jgi:hypothetical protein
LIIYGSVESIEFTKNCKGYLKRAADANTVALARQELAKAVDYLEDAQLSTGSTHVFYATPDCELDFWYENLKSSLVELESIPDDIDQLTASNQLLKLRETIMDNSEKGTKVTTPPNIHVFPNQFLYRSGGAACTFGLAAGLMLIAVESESARKNGEKTDDERCDTSRFRNCLA